MAELPTLRTAIVITALKIEGRAGMVAFVMARTKGEALASAEVLPLRRRGSS